MPILTMKQWGYYTIGIAGRDERTVYAHSVDHAFHIVRANGAGSATLTFKEFTPERRLALAA